MTSGERPADEFNELARSSVDLCKQAAASLRRPEVFWDGLDEETKILYQALPLHQDQELIDISQLGSMPIGAFYGVFNSWTIIRGEVNQDERSIDFTQYTIDHLVMGGIRRATYKKSDEEGLDEESKNSQFMRFIDGLRESAERGVVDDHTDPSQEDVRHLREALVSLMIHNDLWMEEYLEMRCAMTKEELRAERAAQFQLTMPEIDKTKVIPYWTIDTEFGIVYAAKATSPDIAAAIVDEHLREEPGGGLMFCRFSPIEDEHKDKFDLIFSGDIEVVRMIPDSTEPWSKDIDNMTAQQQVAMDRFRDKW